MERKEIILPTEIPLPYDSHLKKLGGLAPDGHRYGVNNRYLTRDGFPWIPVMGEFHFSRYPREFWRQELLKMKALGVTIVSSYVFWIHHEEIRGEWNWSGNNDLRHFTGLIKELGLLFWLRIGPWPHGEARNGGFPDWLMDEEKKGMLLRSDDPSYLACVRELYGQIREQVGLDGDARRGGPVIGMQIENEYGHCGGPGSDDHIRTLIRMAEEAGLTAPFISVTGWGGANIPRNEVLPVMGGYPAHPWTQHTSSLGPMKEYLFKPLSNDARIGGDLAASPQENLTWDPELSPFLTCELGGGIQVTGHRRPWLSQNDVSALVFCSLGSGVNLPGYYMFHGGTNPVGKTGFTQESRETGSPNDVPRLSYDFQAMIGEFGRIRPSARRSKLFHYFLRDFGSLLAPLDPVFPASSPVDPEDTENLRWSVRTDGERGFLFINNYARHQSLPRHEVSFILQGRKGEIRLPSLEIPPDVYGFIPFNMPLETSRGELTITMATVQPICRVSGQKEDIVYFHNFTGCPGSLSIRLPGETQERTLTFADENGRFSLLPGLSFQILSPGEGENLWMGESGGKKVVRLSSQPVTLDDESVRILEETFPGRSLESFPLGSGAYRIPLKGIAAVLPKHEELYLTFDITCDKAELTLDGRLIGDFFYYGEPWEIGLKRFASLIKKDSELILSLTVPDSSEKIYFECPRPEKEELKKIELTGIRTA